MSRFYLLGCLLQWWHCLLHTFQGHCAVVICYGDPLFGGEIVELRCTCGKVFWRRKT